MKTFPRVYDWILRNILTIILIFSMMIVLGGFYALFNLACRGEYLAVFLGTIVNVMLIFATIEACRKHSWIQWTGKLWELLRIKFCLVA